MVAAHGGRYHNRTQAMHAFGFDNVSSLYDGYLVHNMEWIVKGALDFIDASLVGGRPFFLYMAPTLMHGHLSPAAFLDADMALTGAGLINPGMLANVQPSRADVMRRVTERGCQKAGMTWLDDSIGAILAKLEEREIAKDTPFVFASDHQSLGK